MAKTPKPEAETTQPPVTKSEDGGANGLFRPVARVKGPAKGRWRAGRHFGPEEVVLTEDDISAEQLAAIQADPELTVVLDAAVVVPAA